jgi:hypothetical protein
VKSCELYEKRRNKKTPTITSIKYHTAAKPHKNVSATKVIKMEPVLLA